MKRIFITETVLRDAQQSLIATRMPLEDFEGILEKIDSAGIIQLSAGAVQHLTHVLGT